VAWSSLWLVVASESEFSHDRFLFHAGIVTDHVRTYK